MLELFASPTPNGRKVSILLAELGLPYRLHRVDLSKAPSDRGAAFLQAAPNGRIPAIHDPASGVRMMESGAILLWLATQHKRYLVGTPHRAQMLDWLAWQMEVFGPVLGQVHHFTRAAPTDPARAHFHAEARAAWTHLDRHLLHRDYVAGPGRGVLSIADFAILPWALRAPRQGIAWDNVPAARDWAWRMTVRPAVQRGWLALGTEPIPVPGETPPGLTERLVIAVRSRLLAKPSRLQT